MRTPLRPILPAVLVLPALLIGPTGRAADPPRRDAASGSITGVVRYTGKVPPPQKIMASDGSTVEHSDLVVDPKTRGLRHVVAVLDDAPAQPKARGVKPAVVDQKDMVFVPRVVAVQHGQAVRFDNSDNCNHSVQASSAVRANEFNQFAGPGRSIEHVFEPQKHPVLIGCSLHAWMRAWVYVVPHPWFAVSDAQGRFRIENVPPGKYTLLLRHADTGRLERRAVQVEAGRAAEVAVGWDAAGK